MKLKLKLQYFGHLMQKANSLEKTLRLVKIDSRKRRGQQRMRQLDGITDLMDMSLFKLTSIEQVMPSNHLVLCQPPLLLSVFPSIRVFSNESALCIRWPKYWSFSFSFTMSPSEEYPGWISFMIYQFDPLPVQWTLKSLPQHHNLKASILQCLAFPMVQLSHLHMTSGKSQL